MHNCVEEDIMLQKKNSDMLKAPYFSFKSWETHDEALQFVIQWIWLPLLHIFDTNQTLVYGIIQFDHWVCQQSSVLKIGSQNIFLSVSELNFY